MFLGKMNSLTKFSPGMQNIFQSQISIVSTCNSIISTITGDQIMNAAMKIVKSLLDLCPG